MSEFSKVETISTHGPKKLTKPQVGQIVIKQLHTVYIN